jgi:acyl-CoA synthetase (AMP-forming)/AMP-acid ligase II
MASGVLAVAALTAGAAYVDAKLHVSKDLNQLLRLKKAETNFAQAGNYLRAPIGVCDCFLTLHIVVKAKKASGFFLFEAAAKKYQDAPCIWSRQAQYTWSEAYKHVCQYGHYFRDLGVKPSQHVVVYMYNSPELLFIWMGLLSIGAAPALVNYALASDALVHCVRLARAKFLIFDAAPDLAARIQAVDEQLRSLGVEPMELSVDLRNNIDSNPAHPAEVSCFQENRETLPFALMYTR